jgi:SAM-dependent methyltransferase
MTNDREQLLRRFHAAHPGVTARAFARSGSYERLAARVPIAARVLDLGCGDGYLLRLLEARGCRSIGLDLSIDELRAARGPRACGRAEALPFAADAFDACVSHLAFMVMDEPARIVRELRRVLRPGGVFLAVVGGGPTADGDDAFHRFLTLAAGKLRGSRLGDPRTRSEHGWRELFAPAAAWTIDFERHELDLSGSFDEVWTVLGSSYELFEAHVDDVRALRGKLAAACSVDAMGVGPRSHDNAAPRPHDSAPLVDDARPSPHTRVPCRVVTWLASARLTR